MHLTALAFRWFLARWFNVSEGHGRYLDDETIAELNNCCEPWLVKIFLGCWLCPSTPPGTTISHPIQAVPEDQSMKAYLELAVRACADNKFLFPVKPKCHVTWLNGPKLISLQKLIAIETDEAWQEIAYQQEVHRSLAWTGILLFSTNPCRLDPSKVSTRGIGIVSKWRIGSDASSGSRGKAIQIRWKLQFWERSISGWNSKMEICQILLLTPLTTKRKTTDRAHALKKWWAPGGWTGNG